MNQRVLIALLVIVVCVLGGIGFTYFLVTYKQVAAGLVLLLTVVLSSVLLYFGTKDQETE